MAFRSVRGSRDRRFIFVAPDVDLDTQVRVRGITEVTGAGVRVRSGAAAESSADDIFTIRRILRPLQVPSLGISGPSRLLENTGVGEFFVYNVPEFTTTGLGSGSKIRRITVDAAGMITSIDWLRRGTCHTPGDVFTFTQLDASVRYVVQPDDVDEIGALRDFMDLQSSDFVIGGANTQVGQFRADVIGGDYDRISLSWSDLGAGGSFDTTTAAVVRYTPPAVSINTSVTLRCAVTVRGTGAPGVRGRITAATRTFNLDINLIVTDHIDTVAPTLSIQRFTGPVFETLNVVAAPATGHYDRLDAMWVIISAGGRGAAATAALSSGGVSSVTMDTQGEQYNTVPEVRFVGGGGTGAMGTAVINRVGRITGVTIDSPGSGYASAPTVEFISDIGSFNVINQQTVEYTPPVGGSRVELEATITAHGDGIESDLGTTDTRALREIFTSAVIPVFDGPAPTRVALQRGQSIDPIQVPEASGFPYPTYQRTSGVSGLSFSPSTRRIVGVPSTLGSSSFVVQAVNSAGSDTWSLPVWVVQGPRFADDTGDHINSVVGTAVRVTVPPAVAFPVPTYSVVGALPAGLRFAPGSRIISGTPRTAGSGTIVIRATNTYGSDDWTVTYGVLAAPAFAQPTGTPFTSNFRTPITPITVPAATGVPEPTYSATGLPNGLSFDRSTRVISGTPTDAGTGTITIRATNSEGSANWTVDYTILATAPPVFANAMGDAIVLIAGTAIPSVTVPAATGAPTPTYAVVGSLPDGLIFNRATRVISGTPTTAPSGTITIRATNSQGTADWTAEYGPATAPVFARDTGDAIAALTGVAIQEVTVPAARGAPAPTYAVVGSLPTGLSFNPTTRVLSGTLNAVASGTLTIRATNSEGSDDWTVAYAVTAGPGTAIRVGSANQFGIGINNPGGLASHSGSLYMVALSIIGNPFTGTRIRALYTVNPATGVATRVGEVDSFGVSETNPVGLASHSGSLYMIGSNDTLYAVNPVTGVATAVGSGIGVDASPGGLASHNNVLYMVASRTATATDTIGLYTLNTTTGVATRVGNARDFGIAGGRVNNPAGLASHRGVLYMVEENTNALYSLDLTTGIATRVGGVAQFGIGETSPDGLASHAGLLYMVGGINDTLYVINIPGPAVFVVDTSSINLRTGEEIDPITVPAAVGLPVPTYAAIGRLPAGLSFDPNTRVISGTPTTADSGTITIRATNSLGTDDWTANYVISTVARAAPSFTDDTGDAISAVVDTAINAITVPMATGFPTPTYAIVGSLPAGLSFNPATRVISGTPTTADSGTIRIRATNSLGSDDWTVAYTVRAGAPGVATRVGSATRFGVSEGAPNGLASHGGSLYMVGSDTDVLFSLDPTTGIATQVGSASSFGVGESIPQALGSHGGSLYMVGSILNALLTINPATGVATRVGTATQFGVSGRSASGLASHNNVFYMIVNRALYTINPATGVATRVGSATEFGVGERTPRGLASHGGSLYMLGSTNDVLYTLNPATGVATRVGTATQFGVSERDPRALASHGGLLYMIGERNDALFTLSV